MSEHPASPTGDGAGEPRPSVDELVMLAQRVDALTATRRTADAVALLEENSQRFAEDPHFWTMFSGVLLQVPDAARALSCAERALALNPAMAQALDRYISALLGLEQWDRARAASLDYASRLPGSPRPHLLAARAHLGPPLLKQDVETALIAARTALECDPQEPLGYLLGHTAAEILQQRDLSRQLLVDGLAVDPQNPELLLAAQRTRHTRNLVGNSAEAPQSVLAVDPMHEKAQQSLDEHVWDRWLTLDRVVWIQMLVTAIALVLGHLAFPGPGLSVGLVVAVTAGLAVWWVVTERRRLSSLPDGHVADVLRERSGLRQGLLVSGGASLVVLIGAIILALSGPAAGDSGAIGSLVMVLGGMTAMAGNSVMVRAISRAAGASPTGTAQPKESVLRWMEARRPWWLVLLGGIATAFATGLSDWVLLSGFLQQAGGLMWVTRAVQLALRFRNLPPQDDPFALTITLNRDRASTMSTQQIHAKARRARWMMIFWDCLWGLVFMAIGSAVTAVAS